MFSNFKLCSGIFYGTYVSRLKLLPKWKLWGVEIFVEMALQSSLPIHAPLVLPPDLFLLLFGVVVADVELPPDLLNTQHLDLLGNGLATSQ